MARAIKRPAIKQAKRPARLGARYKQEKSVIEIPTILTEPVENDKPIYNYQTGKVEWGGKAYDRKEIMDLLQALTRTPVSRGTFPTEADFVINAARAYGKLGPLDLGASGGSSSDEPLPDEVIITEHMERWHNNYLKALQKIISLPNIHPEVQDDYEEIYWIVRDMDAKDFLAKMERYGDELSIAFEYILAIQNGVSERLLQLWRS